MNPKEELIMDYARWKGGWFTAKEVWDRNPSPNSCPGQPNPYSRACISLWKYGFLVRRRNPHRGSGGSWYQYKDADAADFDERMEIE